jgi:hypothetical protein
MQAAARQYRTTPNELRMAMLNHDRVAVATHAIERGQSPAHLYYAMATQRGYRPQWTLNAAQADELADMAETNPVQFDRIWDRLASTGHL